jgi:hypothetical protein
MSLTEEEKKLLRTLVQHEINAFRKEGKAIVVEDNPGFLALEETYDEFLERLLKKI